MFILRVFAGSLLNLAIFAALLFLPAGTWAWGRAWVFLGVVYLSSLATLLLVFPGNRGLLEERFKLPIQKGQPLADKIVILILIAAFAGEFLFTSLDVHRFHLLPPPSPAVSFFGLALTMAGWWVISLAFKANAFAAPVVRHQAERGQRVIDTGLYAVVRHPMYAGAVLFMIGPPLWLGSYAGALAALAPIATMVVRIGIEERFLRRELPGYDTYTQKVRHRLIPFIW